MPKDFQWQGQLNADLLLDLPASGPKGQVVVDASGGTLRIKDKGQWLNFPYQTFKLTSNLTLTGSTRGSILTVASWGN